MDLTDTQLGVYDFGAGYDVRWKGQAREVMEPFTQSFLHTRSLGTSATRSIRRRAIIAAIAATGALPRP